MGSAAVETMPVLLIKTSKRPTSDRMVETAEAMEDVDVTSRGRTETLLLGDEGRVSRAAAPLE